MKIIRYILLPIVPIYFVITWLRNKLYDVGWLGSKSYDVPTICVGNLTVGGTGKSPMIEYLIRLLKQDHRLATLSRGYGRKTDGFILADEKATAETIGDEPFQFFTKFNDINVAVDANRQNGIETLMSLNNAPDVILLDDAFQHRKVRAKINILLTTFHQLYVDDIVLPTGNLREPRSGSKRANVIIVTKCPEILNEDEKNVVLNKLKPLDHQNVYFSKIKYSENIKNGNNDRPLISLENTSFTLVTGIANPEPLIKYLKSQGFSFKHLKYKDHHTFNEVELDALRKESLILTTEKDYMRLQDKLEDERLWYLPIETEVSNGHHLNQLINRLIPNS